MKRITSCFIILIVALTAPAIFADPAPLTLHSIVYPERDTARVDFVASSRAPRGRLTADVTYRDGQARIEIRFKDMKPAILFSGDVTSYVLWAVTSDGHSENLGELVISEPDGEFEYRTALKKFALIVTAEAYYLVDEPSGLVMFHNAASKLKKAPSSEFTFTRMGPEPSHAMDSIAFIQWDSEVPILLLQAEKAYELAQRSKAEEYAPQPYHEAGLALAEARKLAHKDKKLNEFSRRSIALSNIAMNISHHTLEVLRMEQSIASRREEMASLERSARQAEEELGAARAEAARFRDEMQSLRRERQSLEASMSQLETSMSQLKTSMSQLEAEKMKMESSVRSLQLDKERLSGRLQDALSLVAETRESARGLIVSLPDILFDVNESSLKPEARVVIAKIAGILLVMPEMRLVIEGHTDSTGSVTYNQELSMERAATVETFLVEQGVDAGKIRSAGFGMDRPVADNSTAEGRSRNRRVELVISESPTAGRLD